MYIYTITKCIGCSKSSPNTPKDTRETRANKAKSRRKEIVKIRMKINKRD